MFKKTLLASLIFGLTTFHSLYAKSGLYQQAAMYDVGGDKPQDLTKAENLYQKAADQGSIDAMNALGVLKINKGDYAAAEKLFSKAASKGDEIAYFNLGNLAIIDRKSSQNKAIEMYMKSAEKNYTPALVALGDIYATGKNVEPDLEKAEHYYKKAADLNDSVGIDRLALLYLLQDGLDVEEDTANAKKTLELIQQAASKDNPQALYVLSMVYQNGYLLDHDEDKAIEYLKKSADLGWPEAQYSLAYLYLMGFKVKLDNQKAIKYFKQSADNGYSDAQNNLGMFYLKGEVIDKNLPQAQKYLAMAVEQGNPMAAFNLSSAYALDLLKKPSNSEIRALIGYSANQGYTPAMNKLVEYYAHGKFDFEKDNEKARYWLNKSIEADDSDAMLMLANAYYIGAYGYAKDQQKAVEWLDKAKAYDNPNATALEQKWRSLGRSISSIEHEKRQSMVK